MNVIKLSGVDALVLFGPIGRVSAPNHDREKRQRGTQIKRDAPAVMESGPGNENGSQSSTEAQAGALQSAGKAAFPQISPRGNHANADRRDGRLADSGEETND